MPRKISDLAQVDPRAQLGEDVEIGPFCLIGPHVTLGDGCKLDSHVTIIGHTTIGERNRFFANAVIGGEPQDISFDDSPTQVIIGNENQFREGVTVNRGAPKEDGITRIGDNNLLMANSHVAHNCHIHNRTYLVNGVLLGGHVHVQDRAIISGNSVVHHFARIGRMAFISGGCRVPNDVPPFMLAAGSDNPEIKTINIVGMRRGGISEDAIQTIRKAQKLLFREHKRVEEVRQYFLDSLEAIPIELSELLNFIEEQGSGHNGRAREAVRDQKPQANQGRKAA